MTKRLRFICLAAGCALVIAAAWFRTATVTAQTSPTLPPPAPEPSDPSLIYNPYPAGILPADLNSEILRVRREIRGIEIQAISEWLALPPSTVAGNPPIQEGSGIPAVETLGKLLQYDENISPFKNRACAFCHMPYAAFSGPIPSVNLTMIAYPGSLPYTAGKRTAQRYTYSSYFPPQHYNQTQSTFIGGNFWDGRATGYLDRNAAADQAQGPPVDPLEMEFPDTACIAFRLQTAIYKPLFLRVWGAGSLDITFPPGTEQICDTPGPASKFNGSTTPIPLSPADRDRATQAFYHWGQSLDAYEQSVQVSPFTSKFDAFLAGNATLTADEMAGYQLFNGKGNCNSCHLDGRGTTLKPGQTDTSMPADVNPLFTCFGPSNLGLPLNPRITLFYETTPTFVGFTPNPLGFGYRDLGYGTFLRSGPQTWPNPNSAWTQFAPMSDGQVQTLTARDVALVPPQCTGGTEAPGPYFQKEFFHNGYIKSLKQLVHFYNTRDVYQMTGVTSGHCPPGTVERVTCWPEAEVPATMDMTVGKLGLTDTEENQIVAFLMTLTDGYTTPYPNINTYTGTCMTGGSASTQGNNTIIPTPTGFPCAAAICGVPPLPLSPPPPPI